MRKFLFILFFIVSGASFAQAADLPIKNAGFVPANIWYSKDPFYAGESIRIYTIVFNGSTYDLSGEVEFLDNGVIIGKTKFSLAKGGRVQDVWVDWKATQGAHTITARLINVIGDGPDGKQAVLLDNIEAGKSERVVELDPVALAAQKQAELQKVTDVKNAALGKISDVTSTVGSTIPVSIKENVSTGISALEKFRIGEGFQLQLERENKAKEIVAIKASTTTSASILQKSGDVFASISNATEKPFAYVMFAILAVLQYLFQYQILFYGVILYVVYRLIKLLVRKIRDRE